MFSVTVHCKSLDTSKMDLEYFGSANKDSSNNFLLQAQNSYLCQFQGLTLVQHVATVSFHYCAFSVTVHCKDTRIVVNVGTSRPFSGRIYALGRSETCNVDVINSDSFRLDLTMAGQDCNTQSVVSDIIVATVCVFPENSTELNFSLWICILSS